MPEITFYFYGRAITKEEFSLLDTGHMNIGFTSKDGAFHKYGMNVNEQAENATVKDQVWGTPILDGKVSVEDQYTDEIATKTIYITDEQLHSIEGYINFRLEKSLNYNLFDNSCQTFANDIWLLSGQKGHVIDAFDSIPVQHLTPVLIKPDNLNEIRNIPHALREIVYDWIDDINRTMNPWEWLRDYLPDATKMPWPQGELYTPGLWPPKWPTVPIDPLILDLDHDGIELLNISDSKIFFDFDKDMFAEKTGWVKNDDGFLFRDINNNNAADGIGELFGNHEIDGFTVLRSLDKNQDAIIDNKDIEFSQLKIWRDLNENGKSDQGEIFLLSEYDILNISLNKSPSQDIISGNRIGFTGVFTRTDNSKGAVAAVYFQTDRTLSKYIIPEGFQISAEAMKLPDVKGYGQLRDLRVEATKNPEFAQKIKSFLDSCQKLTGAEITSSFQNILYDWAGADNLDTTSRGPHIDARKIAFLEVFFGNKVQQEISGQFTSSPNASYAHVLQDSFQKISNALLTRTLSGATSYLYNTTSDLPRAAANPFFALMWLRHDNETDSFKGSIQDVMSAAMSASPDNFYDKIVYLDRFMTALSGVCSNVSSADMTKYGLAIHLGLVSIPEVYLQSYFCDIALGKAVNPVIRSSIAYGSDGTDVFVGRAASINRLEGGGGSDTYLYKGEDGTITIYDVGPSKDTDLLALSPNIKYSDVNLVRSKTNTDDLIIKINGDAVSIVVVGQFHVNDLGIEQIRFGDGTVWDRAQIRAQTLSRAATSGDDFITGFNSADTICGGAGNDVLVGLNGDDFIDGGAGNDRLEGGYGSDTYLYNMGDGVDVLYDRGSSNNIDVFVLGEGLTAAQTVLTRSTSDQYDLVLSFNGIAGSVTFDDQFYDTNDGIEEIRFADGAAWNEDQIRTEYLARAATAGNDTILGFASADTIRGGAGDDVLKGQDGDDHLFGEVGNDSLTGGAGNDALDGGAGNDTLSGEAGNDTLGGGTGNDVLYGGGGSNTYLYKAGEGADFIVDSSSSSDIGSLVLGSADLTAAKAVLARSTSDAYDVVLSFAGVAGSVTLDDQFYDSGLGLEEIRFADGTAWNRVQIRTEYLARAATAGNDTIVGFASADTVRGGAGDDVLKGQDGDDRLFGEVGNDSLVGGWGNDALEGDVGNDSLYGEAGNDTLNGGTGNDVLYGGSGSDTYLYRAGDGFDVLVDSGGSSDSGRLVLGSIELSQAKAVLTRATSDTSDVVLSFAGIAGSVTLDDQFYGSGWGIEEIRFADGAAWSKDQIRTEYLARAATSGNDTISGFASADTIRGAAGDDVLRGQDGDDRLFGEVGNDSLIGGWGNDALEGDAGADTLYGEAGNDTLSGGIGNDILYGGSGSDTYLYKAGDGVDVLVDNGSSSDFDILVFGEGVDVNGTKITKSKTDNYDIQISFDGRSEFITIDDQLYNSNYGIDQIAFASGVSWSRSEIFSKIT